MRIFSTGSNLYLSFLFTNFYFMKLKLISGFLLLAILGFGYILWQKPIPVAEAEKLTILNGELKSLGQALGEKNFSNNNDLKLLFDYNSQYALVGKTWQNETSDSESTGGTELYLLDLQKQSEQKIADNLVKHAILDKKNNLVYFTDLSQDLWRFDITKNSKEKIMDKVLQPDLSPDTNFLVYQKLNADWEQNNYYDLALGLTILNLQTLEEKRITTLAEDWGAFWTADSKKIVFFGLNDFDHGMSSHYIIDADGKNKTLLTNFGLYNSTEAGAVPMPSEKPLWSPDGNMLVYHSDYEVWINKFNQDKTKIIESKFITYGKEPTWIKNGSALNVLLVTENQSSTENINVNLEGKIIK
jgi:hypothetical protein